MNENIVLRNDEPTVDDQLERKDLVLSVARAVATCDPPHVFGIHGDWGSGKTSFLYQLQACLTGKCPQLPDAPERRPIREGNKTTVVWFEAWRYQHEAAPIVALLHEIRTQLPWTSKALQEGRKLAEVSIRSALLSLEDLTKKIGISASKIEEAGHRWEEENLATRLPSHTIRQHLEHALKALLGGSKKSPQRLVVMVDDLDRCEARAAYQLLEGIKIYLNLPNCVFVLGMNYKIIESAIEAHLPKRESQDPALRSREYFDKLCQTVVHLPALKDVSRFLGNCLSEMPGAKSICEVVKEENCLPANARKVKAFANLLLRYAPRFREQLEAPGTAPACSQRLLIFACLYHFHPEIYRLIEVHPQFYNELWKWCQQDGSARDHDAFEGLRAPLIPTSPTASDSAFADPNEGNILRIQGLVRKHDAITPTDVQTFLVE